MSRSPRPRFPAVLALVLAVAIVPAVLVAGAVQLALALDAPAGSLRPAVQPGPQI